MLCEFEDEMNLLAEGSQAKLKTKTLEISGVSELKGTRGVYTLIIFVPSVMTLKIGGLGERKIERGYYAYTGSAMGNGSSSLAGRISRHLKKNKRERWHIDYLLNSEDVKIKAVLVMVTERRMECEINQHLMSRLEAGIPILNFGSSDCRMGCRSHLLYLGLNDNVVSRTAELYLQKKEGEIFVFLNC